MLYDLNKPGRFVLFLCLVTSLSVYSVENTEGWSTWFANKVSQYKNAAQNGAPRCEIFGNTFTAELGKQPYAVTRAFDKKLDGHQTAAFAVAFDLIKSLGCLSATTLGATLGVTKEVANDITHKISDILEFYYRGEISQKQAQMAIEKSFVNASKIENLA